MFKDLKKEDFEAKFAKEHNCLQFLYDIKWKGGFRCRRCGNRKCWNGRTKFHSRCTKCDYDESVTANTMFHKIQFSLTKAFTIVYYVTELRNGVSCRNLAGTLNIGLKAVWKFKRKVQDAMGKQISANQDQSPQEKITNVDGIIVLHRKKELNGLQKVSVKIQRAERGGKKQGAIRRIVCKIDQEVFDRCSLAEGRYVKDEKSILIWNFRTGLTGTHHHCSIKYLQGYLDEFCFRMNNRRNKKVWIELMEIMICQKSGLLSETGPKGKIVV